MSDFEIIIAALFQQNCRKNIAKNSSKSKNDINEGHTLGSFVCREGLWRIDWSKLPCQFFLAVHPKYVCCPPYSRGSGLCRSFARSTRPLWSRYVTIEGLKSSNFAVTPILIVCPKFPFHTPLTLFIAFNVLSDLASREKALVHTRLKFRENQNLTETSKIEELVNQAEQACKYIQENVVQGVRGQKGGFSTYHAFIQGP